MTPTAGEKEIVLGNKQLLGLFIVAVVMLAVFFAAGYMIGQKSIKPVETAQTTTEAPPSAGKSPLPKPDADPVREPAQTNAPVETTPPASAQPNPEPAAASTATAKPAPTMPLPEPPVYKEEPKPAPKAPKADPKAIALMVPEKGVKYVQVTALPRPDSDNLVRSLRAEKMPAILTESSKEGLYRVLVGPFKEDAKISETKIKLKALGFAQAIQFVRK